MFTGIITDVGRVRTVEKRGDTRFIVETAYDPETIAADFEYIATKLDISVPELRALCEGPCHTWRDYKNSMAVIDVGTRVLRTLGVQRALIR